MFDKVYEAHKHSKLKSAAGQELIFFCPDKIPKLYCQKLFQNVNYLITFLICYNLQTLFMIYNRDDYCRNDHDSR